MDLGVHVTAHRAEWERLDQLLRRGGKLTGAEADELVALYQRAATHLSIVQPSVPDPMLTTRLTQLVARAHATVTGTRHWWTGTHPEVQASIGAPAEPREPTRPGGQYETYYSSHPAASFAAQVWTNNAQAAAMCLVLGAFLGIPVLWILFLTMLNPGVGIGLMSSEGRLHVFLGLVLPHGLLELTTVFVAAVTGLRLGWTVVEPGPTTRRAALAERGRAAVGMAIGLALVLFVSCLIEGFVTPSDLPTRVRITIGVTAEPERSATLPTAA